VDLARSNRIEVSSLLEARAASTSRDLQIVLAKPSLYNNWGAQYLDPEEHLLPYWGELQQVRKCKNGLENWT
jgi:hypothetical protein